MSRKLLVVLMAVVSAAACAKTKKGSSSAKGVAPAPGQASNLPPQSPQELAEPIAKVDNYTITVGEFEDRINKQSPFMRAKFTSLEQKKDFLENLIRFEVLAEEAKRRGYDQDPEVVRTMKQVMIQKLMKEQFDDSKAPDVPDDEAKKFYDEHQNEYNKPEEIRVSAIVTKDKGTADKAMAEAKALQPTDSKGFRDLVAKYSTDEDSKARGGDLKWFDATTKDVPADVVKAAFTLEKQGDLAGPIQSDKGFYVIKQDGRRKAVSRTFEEVKRQIVNRLYQDKRKQAMDDFVKNLRNQAKVDIHEDALAKVRVDTTVPPSGPGAPGMPPGPMIGPGAPGMAPMPTPPAPPPAAPGNR